MLILAKDYKLSVVVYKIKSVLPKSSSELKLDVESFISVSLVWNQPRLSLLLVNRTLLTQWSVWNNLLLSILFLADGFVHISENADQTNSSPQKQKTKNTPPNQNKTIPHKKQ